MLVSVVGKQTPVSLYKTYTGKILNLLTNKTIETQTSWAFGRVYFTMKCSPLDQMLKEPYCAHVGDEQMIS